MANPDLSEFIVAKKCVVGALAFDKEQREKFDAACAMPTSVIPSTEIMRVLDQWGFKVKKTSLSEHRRGKCRCND